MVGPFEVYITVVPKINKSDSLGEYTPTTHGGHIRLKQNHRTPTEALDTVTHEVLHAIWDKAAVNPAFEEDMVAKVATWQTGVWMSNHKLFTWMAKCITEV
jgi:hypothetical protein